MNTHMLYLSPVLGILSSLREESELFELPELLEEAFATDALPVDADTFLDPLAFVRSISSDELFELLLDELLLDELLLDELLLDELLEEFLLEELLLGVINVSLFVDGVLSGKEIGFVVESLLSGSMYIPFPDPPLLFNLYNIANSEQ